MDNFFLYFFLKKWWNSQNKVWGICEVGETRVFTQNYIYIYFRVPGLGVAEWYEEGEEKQQELSIKKTFEINSKEAWELVFFF